MPALYSKLGERALHAAPHLAKRNLEVNHTQAVTLGVMAVYVVVIALLWNLPYVRWSLWPFKVSLVSDVIWLPSADGSDAGDRIP